MLAGLCVLCWLFTIEYFYAHSLYWSGDKKPVYFKPKPKLSAWLDKLYHLLLSKLNLNLINHVTYLPLKWASSCCCFMDEQNKRRNGKICLIGSWKNITTIFTQMFTPSCFYETMVFIFDCALWGCGGLNVWFLWEYIKTCAFKCQNWELQCFILAVRDVMDYK